MGDAAGQGEYWRDSRGPGMFFCQQLAGKGGWQYHPSSWFMPSLLKEINGKNPYGRLFLSEVLKRQLPKDAEGLVRVALYGRQYRWKIES